MKTSIVCVVDISIFFILFTCFTSLSPSLSFYFAYQTHPVICSWNTSKLGGEILFLCPFLENLHKIVLLFFITFYFFPTGRSVNQFKSTKYYNPSYAPQYYYNISTLIRKKSWSCEKKNKTLQSAEMQEHDCKTVFAYRPQLWWCCVEVTVLGITRFRVSLSKRRQTNMLEFPWPCLWFFCVPCISVVVVQRFLFCCFFLLFFLKSFSLL